MSDVEEWRAVVGWEGLYEVSSLGRVRSVARHVNWPNENNRQFRPSCILRQRKTRGGYLIVAMSNGEMVKYSSVHRLVAIAFLGNPPTPEHTVNHISGVKTQNSVSNLEWCTQSENVRHAFRTGLKKQAKGIDSGRSKFSREQILQIAARAVSGEKQDDIARSFGVSQTAISAIVTGKKHSDVTGISYSRIGPGRNPRSHGHHRANLTEQDVRDIRRLRADGVSRPEIASIYSISTCTVTEITMGRAWTHVA